MRTEPIVLNIRDQVGGNHYDCESGVVGFGCKLGRIYVDGK